MNKKLLYVILIIFLIYYILQNNVIEHVKDNFNKKCKVMFNKKCIAMFNEECKTSFSDVVETVNKLDEYGYICEDQYGQLKICDNDDIEKKILTKENCKKYNELFEEGKTYYIYPWDQEIKFEKVSVNEMLKYEKYKTNFYGLNEKNNSGYLTNLYKIKDSENNILKIKNDGSGFYYAEFSDNKTENIPDYAVWRIIPIIDDKYIIIDEHQWFVILSEHSGSSKKRKILDSSNWFSLTDKDLYKDSRQVFTITETKRSELDVLREKDKKNTIQSLYNKEPVRKFCNETTCEDSCISLENGDGCTADIEDTKPCPDGYYQEFTDTVNDNITGSDLDGNPYFCDCGGSMTVRLCVKKGIGDSHWQTKFKEEL